MLPAGRIACCGLCVALVGAGTLQSHARSAAASKTLSRGEPVSAYLTVEEGDKLIQGFRQGNFRVAIDDQACPFRLETPETPVSIALLVEYSESSAVYFDDIDAAMQGFLEQAPPDNWYALATFSKGLHVDMDFTKVLGRIEDAYSTLGQPVWQEIDTYDAVYQMLDTMGRLPGRRVLIFIGSGVDTFSAHTLQEVLDKAEAENVTIYGVAAGTLLRGMYSAELTSSAEMTLVQARSFLQALAKESGGQAWFPNTDGAYPDIIKGIFQSLLCQYRLVLEYRPPHDGKLHKLKVEAFQLTDDRRKDFKVRVREGWRSEP